MALPYLLDTNILLHWLRNSPQSETIEQRYRLFDSRFRPLICDVSLGEMRSFARGRKWGRDKLERLRNLEKELTAVDISDPRVLDAYADLSTLAKQNGWSIFKAKNDLWIAAAAVVTQSHLLTMDRDFLPLRNHADCIVTVLDQRSALPFL